MPFPDDPSLARVLQAELAAGNAVAAIFREPCDRENVALQRPFSRDWPRELDDPAVYASDRIETRAIDHGEFETTHESILETERAVLRAPFVAPGRDAARGAGPPGSSDSGPRTAKGPIPLRLLLLRLSRAIENDLRDAGVWREGETRAPPFRAAFGADAMPFSAWLQLVFLPRLREIADRDLPLPAPGVAAYAVREFDGDERFADLRARLIWLDALAMRRGGAAPPVSLALAGRRAAVSLGFVAAMVAVAAVAIGIGLAVASAIESTGAFTSRRALRSMQATGLHSAPAAELELRADARLDGDAGGVVDRLELVTLRARPFRGIVPGARPLGFDPAAPPESARVEEWFVVRGADADRAREDARIVLELAASLLGIPGGIDAIRLPPPWQELGSSTRHEYRVGMGENIRAAIVVSVLALMLVPAAWWGVRNARRTLEPRGS